MIAEAIRRAREKGGDYWDGAKLAAAIRANPTFDSVYGGDMTFQDNGVAKKRVALFEVEGRQEPLPQLHLGRTDAPPVDRWRAPVRPLASPRHRRSAWTFCSSCSSTA